MIKKLPLALVICFALTSIIKSQDMPANLNELPTYGIFADFNYNIHFADFYRLPNTPSCCPMYDNGSGTGFSIGGLYQYNLNSLWSAGLRLGYYSLNGELSQIEATSVRIVSTNEIRDGKFEHKVKGYIGSLSIEPYVNYKTDYGIELLGGLNIGTLIRKNFEQSETIIEPSDRGVFVKEGTRVRNFFSGKIPEGSGIYFGVSIGAAYPMPMNSDNTLKLVPELIYTHGFTNIASNTDWSISSLRIGFSVKYSPVPHIPQKEHFTSVQSFDRIDTVIVKSYEITKDFLKSGMITIVRDTVETQDSTIITSIAFRTDTLFLAQKLELALKSDSRMAFEQNISVSYLPLLSSIFFNDSSAQLSDFYNSTPLGNIQIPKPEWDSQLSVCKNILPIIADRLKSNKNAIITLVGYSDPFSENIADSSLSVERCITIRELLSKKFGVDTSQIKIGFSENDYQPPITVKETEDSAFAENRRVDIFSNVASILSPVKVVKKIDAPLLQKISFTFSPNYNSTNGVKQCQIKIQNGEKTILDSTMSQVPSQFDYMYIASEGSDVDLSKDFTYSLFITDTQNGEKKIAGAIPFKTDTSYTEVSKDFYVLFDIAKDQLSQTRLQEFESLLDNSWDSPEIKVSGYSDIIGGERTNKKLSISRAKHIKSLIEDKLEDADFISIKGYPNNVFPSGIQSHSTPQERYYSRTVHVEVRIK